MKLLEPGHPDREALRDPELTDWIAGAEAAELFAANGYEVRA